MSSGNNPGNVIGGHKANLKNPNTSEESKEHSRSVLEQAEDGTIDLTGSSGSDHATDESGKETNRVLGGFKATLHNPNVGEEAKQHAKHELEKHGVDVE
ncbi:Conidiation protein 6-domain-containing protein [Thelephora terrestris]|uniref:Conidiation protein 6-domain-containing protein n=1 Tax=Thelephora terrestris TaxID=56493 RepID=A0A9P6HT22_9AGAM|nr:Conidiation protein 6-domain-containing protein [Thelephora terrestris]